MNGEAPVCRIHGDIGDFRGLVLLHRDREKVALARSPSRPGRSANGSRPPCHSPAPTFRPLPPAAGCAGCLCRAGRPSPLSTPAMTPSSQCATTGAPFLCLTCRHAGCHGLLAALVRDRIRFSLPTPGTLPLRSGLCRRARGSGCMPTGMVSARNGRSLDAALFRHFVEAPSHGDPIADRAGRFRAAKRTKQVVMSCHGLGLGLA